MSQDNEDKFYNALQDIFTGAKIEGKGGFVNLLKIKSAYFNKILAQLKGEIADNPFISGNFKEEFYALLYSFFEKYFSEAGCVYFVKTANWQQVYEKVYSANKDVMLFWKTHMLYYVKSDILYNEMIVTPENGDGLKFLFDVNGLKGKQNTEKRELVFTLKKKAGDIVTLEVKYKTGKNRTNLDNIAKSAGIKQEILESAIGEFKKQTQVDYFINKNARMFLTEQLDLYLHQVMLADENIFNQNRLNQLKSVKVFAEKIIVFISQFEDELVKVYNKQKFVLNSNYVITLDRVPEKIIRKLAAHKGMEQQIAEWKELGIVDKSFTFDNGIKENHRLPIDTRYFKDLEMEIISQFDDLDSALDGRLINSENYQALNSLKAKYKEKIDLIYIDPPFNTGNDFLYVDRYQDSTWLSLMNDRLLLAKDLLSDKGSFYLHLDENADFFGRILFSNLGFSEIKKITFDTNATKDEEADLFGYKSFGNNFVLKSQTIYFGKKPGSVFNKLWKPNRNETHLDIGWLDLLSYPRENVKNHNKIMDFVFGVERYKNGKLIFDPVDIGSEKIYPISDIWNDIFSFTQSEMRVSENISFTSAQKPENLLRRIIQASSLQGGCVLDFFAGSGTAAVVAHKLNRKYIGIESGAHFNEFYTAQNGEKRLGLLGRMKIVLKGDISFKAVDKYRRAHLSKDINWDGGGFFKYYKLEQYEDTLRRMNYSETTPGGFYSGGQNAFENYIFKADQKFAGILDIEGEKAAVNFDRLYHDIDFAETISNSMGLPIKKITEKTVVLSNGEEIKTDYKNMTNDEKISFIRMLKPFIWWGE